MHYLGAQNVTLGCGLLTYCPSENVTRDAMASFIAKAIVAPGGGNAVPLTYTDPVTTLSYSCDTRHPGPPLRRRCRLPYFLQAHPLPLGERNRVGLLLDAVLSGQTVTRDAMAKFIANGFGLRLYRP